MIRIDLKKEELESTPEQSELQQKIEELLVKYRLKGIVPTKKSDINPNAVLVLAIFVALSYLPTFALDRYKETLLTQYRAKIEERKKSMKALRKEVAKFAGYKTELASYEQQKQNVRKRLSAVNALLDVRATPVNVLDAIGQSLPRRVWLKRVTVNLKDADSDVLLSGVAYSNEEISDYMDKLNDSIYFGNIQLKSVGTTTEEGRENLRSFELDADATVASSRDVAKAK